MPETHVMRTAPDAIAAVSSTRSTLGACYVTLLRWKLAQIGATVLPMVIVVQSLLAAGIIIGFGFLIPGIDRGSALFLSTGAPAALLMIVGLVLVPSGVADARADGSLAYLRALPVLRPLLFVVELTVWLSVALPSVAAAVLVATLRFDLTFTFDWPLLVGASLLVTLTAASVGYAIAVALPPLLAQLTSQVLVFVVLLFSPITFPASRLPGWLETAHDVLPMRPGADLLRAGLASGTYSSSGTDLAVLLAWCSVATALSLRALVRRA